MPNIFRHRRFHLPLSEILTIWSVAMETRRKGSELLEGLIHGVFSKLKIFPGSDARNMTEIDAIIPLGSLS